MMLSRSFVTVACVGLVLMLAANPAPTAGDSRTIQPLGVHSLFPVEAAILRASDAQEDDRFGAAAVSGDTVVVGAQWEDGGPGDPLDAAGEAGSMR